jgi:S1-C subfamily serine protease
MSPRPLFIAAGLVAGCAAGAPAAPQLPPPATESTEAKLDTVDRLARSAVTLRVLREGLWGTARASSEGLGSGFVVSTSRGNAIVTAAHVVAGATDVVAIDLEGDRHELFEVYAFDRRHDVAILGGERLDTLPVVDLGEVPAVGREIVLVSAPLGLSTTVAFGSVAAHRPEDELLQLAAGVSPGSSGGLVADRSGNVVAIIHAKAPAHIGGENITLATPVAVLRTMLGALRPTPLSQPPDLAKMTDVTTHRVLSIREERWSGYPGSASLTVTPGSRPVEHVCVRADAGAAVLALRELGRDDPKGWREGMGEACASLAGDQPLEIVVGTKRVGEPVSLTVRRQP